MNNQTRTQTRATALIVRAWRPSVLAILVIAAATLLLIPEGLRVVYAQTNNDATGLPRIVVSAESPGILAADTWDIRDADGLPYGLSPGYQAVGDPDDGQFIFDFSYQWIRVDGMTETNVGSDSPRYQLTDADFGKTFKVRVSFTDRADNAEAVTSVPFGPIARPVSLPSPSTLVSNTGSILGLTTTVITSDPMDPSDYAIGFRLGDHGQGYEISSVSIDLAAVPSSGLSVSLWTGGPHGSSYEGTRTAKLFEFENPDSFAVGLNEFTAPAGVHALQALNHWIVLSGFGSSLSIKEITSDDQDSSSVPGALIDNEAGGNSSVLRLDIKGWTRTQGILAANLAQPNSEGNQEIISVGDDIGWTIDLGQADRFLVRGVAFAMDNTTSADGGMDNPWHFRSDDLDGAIHFRMFLTRNVNGLPTFTAPQGATVPGDSTYALQKGIGSKLGFVNDGDTIERIGAVLSRTLHVDVAADGNTDVPAAAGTTLGKGEALTQDAAGPTPHMVVYGVPLYTLVKNLGQTDNGHVSVGGSNDVVSQGFTTGSRTGGYTLPGIGVNIEGSKVSGTSQIPADASAVSVSVHADSSGQPGAKLFDLLSPTEYAAGHSFFEAPRGARLEPSTSYVLVWRHNSGANHRLVKTTANGEDSGAESGASIANAFRLGADVASLTQDSGGNALEITVYTGQSPPNATGRPVILSTAEDHGVLAVDTSGIADPDGIPNVGRLDSTGVLRNFRYRWIRVDGSTETVVGADSVDYRQIGSELEAAGHRVESGRYRLVEADAGKLLKVEVSFFDEVGTSETVTSLPFRPVREPPLPESTLVSNTGQSPSAQATITSAPYSMGFKLGSHGQGYNISGVSIDLAAAPSSLTVSLWAGRAPGVGVTGAHYKLFEFESPETFRVGLNKFKAPPAAFVYQNVDYWIELAGFGDSLSINRTTSDDEDAGGEPGAALADSVDGGSSVLRLAVKGSRRDHGILVSTYAQTRGHQEIVSLGDEIGIKFTVGGADKYLIRGATFSADNTANGGGFTTPWSLRDGTDELFKLISTRQVAGINEFTAPQGVTVPGGCTTVMSVETCEEYNFYKEIPDPREGGVVLSRYQSTTSTKEDGPKAAGVSIGDSTGDFAITDNENNDVRVVMAIFGEPLNAMVQNLGQADNSYIEVGSASTKMVSQGFTTGSDDFGYRLQGIGINIEGSSDRVPDGPASVLVSVHADSGGKPGAKLFDLIHPTDLGAGHRFFEAPPGTYLSPDTSYVMVWRYNRGTRHRLQQTLGNGEDSGKLAGSSIANAFYGGFALAHMAQDGNGNALELAVYTEVNTRAPFVEGGIPVPLSWLHIPDGAYAGYQFRALFVTHHAIDATSNDKTVYDDLVNFEAQGKTKRREAAGLSGEPFGDQIIQKIGEDEQFKSVVCTAADKNARRNTDMMGIGVPIHWLDGGLEHRDTLVANSNSQFFGPEWVQDEWGAKVTGNSTPLFEISVDEATRGDKIADGIWTGCDSTGMAHSDYHLGSTMEMATLGTPADESTGNAPIGPTASNTGMVAIPVGEYRSIYAISPVFTVVGGEHSILPPRNVRGEVDENTLALTLSWDPPGGYEEVDLRYNIWWRNPSSGNAWETVKTKRARLDPAQFDTGANRNHGYSETESAGSLSATTFDYGGVTYTVRTLIDQRLIADSTETADLFLRLTPQPTAALDAALTLAFDNGDSVDLDNATRTDTAADTVNDVPAYSFYTWVDEGIEFQEGVPVLFNFYDGNGNALIDSQTGVVVDGTTWTDDRSDRRYGVQAIDAEGRTSPRVDYVCSERTGCVIPGG